MGRLDNKFAVVTGATSGIGEATAIMFAKEGAVVVGTGRNEAKGAELLAKIEEVGGKGYFFKCDVRYKDQLQARQDFALEKMGTVNVLFNCTGVCPPFCSFLEQTDENLQLVFETNFRSYAWGMQMFIPDMIAAGGGSIINVASISSIWPELGSFYYGSMKAAVSNLSMNVAKEFAKQKVRVNTILPGPIMTNMTPDFVKNNPEEQAKMIEEHCYLGRLGVPDDIAYGAVYLASDESFMMTGEALVIDCCLCISN
ncbi:MAG: SDR family oxidoreductase [Coriobacteriales bacterium]|nr:SDR family oxidoreductase [Coriobacteriales bacterium]